MNRNIGAIFVGSLLIASAHMVLFLLWLRPPGTEATAGYILSTLAFGLVVAALAGYATGRIAHADSLRPVLAVTALVVAFMSVVSLMAEAGSEPAWHRLAYMVIAAAGALAGGRIAGGRYSEPSAA